MHRNDLMAALEGIALTTVTPLESDGKIDTKGIARLVEYLMEAGLTSRNGFLVPLSTTGNFGAHNLEEKKATAKAFLAAAAGRVPVVIGCNNTHREEILALATVVQDLGASGIMVSPPYYWKPTPQQIVDHFHYLAETLDIGIIVYNNHWATQVDIAEADLARIFNHPNVVGLKESTFAVTKLVAVCRNHAAKLNIYNGLGEPCEPMYRQLGCRGFTSTLGNAFPAEAVALEQELRDQDWNGARLRADRLRPVAEFLDGLGGGQYIAALKILLHRRGICGRYERPPISPLTAPQCARLHQLLENAGLS